MAYDNIIEHAAQTYNVHPALLRSVLTSESDGDPNAISPKGASGLMQLMPDTAKEMGVTDINDPVQNIYGGARYLALQLDKYGDVPTSLAAYNAGPGAVDQHGGIPPYSETQKFVGKTMNKFAQLQNAAPQQQQLVGGAPSTAIEDPFAGLQDSNSGAAAPPTVAPAQAPGAIEDPFAGLADTQADASTIPGAPATKPAAPAAAPAPMTPADAVYKALNLLTPAGALLQTYGTGNPLQDLKDIGSGAVSGAATIGSNLLAKAKPAMAGLPFDSMVNPDAKQTQASVDEALQSLTGANPKAALWGAGKLGAQVAGTSGVGGLIGGGLRALPVVGDGLGPLATAIESGGMSTGLKPSGFWQGAGNWALRELGGATSGAAQAALVDPSQAKTGAAIGAAAPPVVGLGAAVGRNIVNTIAPLVNPAGYVGRGIAKMMSPDEAAQAAQNISSAPTYVPGSGFTAAQVSGSPLLLQTEKAAAATPSGKTAQLKNLLASNDARVAALQQVAQTPDALEAALGARSAATQPLYDAAHRATVKVGPVFDEWASNPTVAQAMSNGNKLAQDDALAGRGVAPVWPTADDRTINGAAVDYTSRALGDMMKNEAPGTARYGTLAALKSKVDDWMGNFIPGVADARSAYAQASVPVNTMQVGQKITDALGIKPKMLSGTNSQEGDIALQLGPYTSAYKAAMKNTPRGIDPQAQATLDAITQDLQRGTISNSIKSPGSDTAYNIAANGWLPSQIYGPTFGGSTAVGKLTGAALGALGAGHIGMEAGLAGMAGGYGLASKFGKVVGHNLEGALAQHLFENPAGLVPYLNARAAAAGRPMLGQGVVPQLLTRAAPVVAGSAGGRP